MEDNCSSLWSDFNRATKTIAQHFNATHMEIVWARSHVCSHCGDFRSIKTQLLVMENSDTMKHYLLHTTPYFCHSSTIFSPSAPPSCLIQGSTPRIADNCHCPCTCVNELSNLSSTGYPDHIMCPFRKHQQDDDK